ncbi:unnamed protein product [Victoria cruziana]
MEGRDNKANDDQERVSLDINLNLSLAPPPPSQRPLPAPPQQLLPVKLYPFSDASPPVAGCRDVHGSGSVGGGGVGSGGVLSRRSSVRQPLKQDPIPPPYPWATDKRATVHSLEYLENNGIHKISGQVCCKRCEELYTMEVDLKKVYEVGYFVFNNLHRLHNRAPKEWLTPRPLDCDKCKQEACVKPVTDEKKKNINWLFLLATESLGYCTLEQLKYFCKHTKSHRTGAKDRVLHDTYIGLLQQLYPSSELIHAFVKESANGVLELQVQDPFHRLLLHGVCEFYNVIGVTVTRSETDNPKGISKIMQIKKKSGCLDFPPVKLIQFLRMARGEINGESSPLARSFLMSEPIKDCIICTLI